MNSEELAASLKRRRGLIGVTQRDLAQLAGVSLHTVIDLESGESNPTLGVLNKVLETLGLRIEISTGGIEPPEP